MHIVDIILTDDINIALPARCVNAQNVKLLARRALVEYNQVRKKEAVEE